MAAYQSAMGDLNGDGRIDLVAAEPNAAGGGAIKILFFNGESTLNTDETVTISSTEGSFGDGINEGDQFGGRESAPLGDIDNDGTIEIAVGAFQSDGGTGAIWILSLDPLNFNVLSKTKIAPGLAGFNESIPTDVNPNGTSGGQFGHAMAVVGDLNGDGITDLVTGPLSFEQCALIMFENSAVNMTYNERDGRCIVKDETAILTDSQELSEAYTRVCR